MEKQATFAIPIENGDIAQLVEQRTENPCVAGSNPAITTQTPKQFGVLFFNVF